MYAAITIYYPKDLINKKWTGNAFFKTFLVSDFQWNWGFYFVLVFKKNNNIGSKLFKCGMFLGHLTSFIYSLFIELVDLVKDLWRNGRNTQITKYIVGGTQKPLQLYWYLIFSWFFLWNHSSMHIKAKGMTRFDIFHVFVENSVNSELCFFWALLKPAKIWNWSQNAHVWVA